MGLTDHGGASPRLLSPAAYCIAGQACQLGRHHRLSGLSPRLMRPRPGASPAAATAITRSVQIGRSAHLAECRLARGPG